MTNLDKLPKAELLPCPFCGSKDVCIKDRRQTEDNGIRGTGVFRAKLVEIFCMDVECGASLKASKMGEQRLIERWNARPAVSDEQGLRSAIADATLCFKQIKRMVDEAPAPESMPEFFRVASIKGACAAGITALTAPSLAAQGEG